MSTTPRVHVVPGPGVVARSGPVVAVLADETDPTAASLVALLERLGSGPLEPRRFTRELLAWCTTIEADPAPAIGAVGHIGQDVAVVLQGDMACRIERPSGDVLLHGRDAVVSVNMIVDGPISRTVIHPEGADPADDETRYHLGGGVVPGRAVVVVHEPGGGSVGDDAVRDPATAAATPPRAPLPTAQDEGRATRWREVATPAGDDRRRFPTVGFAIACEEGHRNDPRSVHCSECGRSLEHHARVAVGDGASPAERRDALDPEQDPPGHPPPAAGPSVPSMQEATAGTPRVRRRTVVVSVAAGLAGLAGMVAFLASADRDGREERVDEEVAATGTEPDLAPEVSCDGTRCIQIDQVRIEDDELLVHWTPHGFDVDRDVAQVHFFWDVHRPEQAGVNAADFGTAQAPWEPTVEHPFVPQSQLQLANRPPEAAGICATVADADHAVIEPANHHCVALPEDD